MVLMDGLVEELIRRRSERGRGRRKAGYSGPAKGASGKVETVKVAGTRDVTGLQETVVAMSGVVVRNVRPRWPSLEVLIGLAAMNTTWTKHHTPRWALSICPSKVVPVILR